MEANQGNVKLLLIAKAKKAKWELDEQVRTRLRWDMETMH